MTETSTSMSINQPSAQTELFRPSLHYPMHPYAEMLTRTAERYPENEAVLLKEMTWEYTRAKRCACLWRTGLNI